MKFIHIADVHLGVKPDQGKPWSEQRARQIWDSFADVIGVAKREKPEFLFVTGRSFPRTAAQKGGAGGQPPFRRDSGHTGSFDCRQS